MPFVPNLFCNLNGKINYSIVSDFVYFSIFIPKKNKLFKKLGLRCIYTYFKNQTTAQVIRANTYKYFVFKRFDHNDYSLFSCSSSHQGLQVRQVDVAVFVHLHHLNLHARHLSARWVGAVGRFGDQADLKQQVNHQCCKTDPKLIPRTHGHQ